MIANLTTEIRSLSEIRAAIPAHLFVQKTWKGLAYLARDLFMAAIAWQLAAQIDRLCASYACKSLLGEIGSGMLRWMLWLT